MLSAGGDYLYGAFTYRLWTTLALGRTLMVDDFCAVGLAGERTPAHALFAAADEVAQQHECEAVCVKFLDGDRAEQNWHSYADGAAYVPIPAVAKRID
ncbi:hypothetical protein CKO21_03445 [Rhodovibrio salinarum]|uniref:Uncharacterized protein n=1 Tax=Rhodovibrio salinarum TaxID=1087 RepID=A0A934UZD8_9PROT|nr:hypothetical protein [Rhodovibrio salinarum]